MNNNVKIAIGVGAVIVIGTTCWYFYKKNKSQANVLNANNSNTPSASGTSNSDISSVISADIDAIAADKAKEGKKIDTEKAKSMLNDLVSKYSDIEKEFFVNYLNALAKYSAMDKKQMSSLSILTQPTKEFFDKYGADKAKQVTQKVNNDIQAISKATTN